jgi:hypothetical protein
MGCQTKVNILDWDFLRWGMDGLTDIGNEKPVLLGEDSIMHSAVDENLLFEYPHYEPMLDDDDDDES